MIYFFRHTADRRTIAVELIGTLQPLVREKLEWLLGNAISLSETREENKHFTYDFIYGRSFA